MQFYIEPSIVTNNGFDCRSITWCNDVSYLDKMTTELLHL